MNDFDNVLKTAAAQYKPNKAIFDRVKKNIHSRKSSVTVVFFSENFGEIMNKIYRENAKKQKKYLHTLIKNNILTFSK